jgi:hypothetical protein
VVEVDVGQQQARGPPVAQPHQEGVKARGGAGADERLADLPGAAGFGPRGVSHVVAVAGPLHGTAFPLAAQGALIGCRACADLATGSPFIEALTRPPEAPLPTRWTTVVTRYDELVLLYTSSVLDESLGNVDNVILQAERPPTSATTWPSSSTR